MSQQHQTNGNFMNMVKGSMKVSTENGAKGYLSTKNALVDINYKIPYLRKNANSNIIYSEDYFPALQENEKYALRWLMYLRDIRGGLGERDSFITIIACMSNEKNNKIRNFANKLILNIPEYGRWDDVIKIYFKTTNNYTKQLIEDMISKQLRKDLKNVNIWNKDNNAKIENVSLLGKWMPSINTSSDKSKNMAKVFVRKLFKGNNKNYRKSLSKIRKYLDVVERKMCNNTWDKITYSAVPSKASMIYRNAFIKHDTDRYNSYIEDVKAGKSIIHAGTLSLYDIPHIYKCRFKNVDNTLEEQWKEIKKPSHFENTIVVRDGSGSMWVDAGNSSVSALDVADGVSIYMAQNNATKGFKNKMITFSKNPKYIDISGCNSLLECLKTLQLHDDCSNTNLERVFDLILDTAVENHLKSEELPNVLIISDMEFDEAISNNTDTLFEVIQKKYEDQGYKLPKLIFWNVNSRSNAIPMKENDNGVILVSGFSNSIANMVCSNELDPFKALKEILNNPRYSRIDSIIKADLPKIEIKKKNSTNRNNKNYNTNKKFHHNHSSYKNNGTSHRYNNSERISTHKMNNDRRKNYKNNSSK